MTDTGTATDNFTDTGTGTGTVAGTSHPTLVVGLRHNRLTINFAMEISKEYFIKFCRPIFPHVEHQTFYNLIIEKSSSKFKVVLQIIP